MNAVGRSVRWGACATKGWIWTSIPVAENLGCTAWAFGVEEKTVRHSEPEYERIHTLFIFHLPPIPPICPPRRHHVAVGHLEVAHQSQGGGDRQSDDAHRHEGHGGAAVHRVALAQHELGGAERTVFSRCGGGRRDTDGGDVAGEGLGNGAGKWWN